MQTDDSLSNFTSPLKMRQRCTLQGPNRARPASSSARAIRLASPLLSAVTAGSIAKTVVTKSDAVSDNTFFRFFSFFLFYTKRQFLINWTDALFRLSSLQSAHSKRSYNKLTVCMCIYTSIGNINFSAL